MNYFSDPLIQSATKEKRVLIMLSMIRGSPSDSQIEEVLSARLNWPWIIMQAMHHRTICTLWHNLKSKNLINIACRSGLAKNWIVYCEQLARASSRKNKLWLELLSSTLENLNKNGIEIVCIKGSALIGDIYQPELRMLGDIDTLIQRKDRSKISAPLKELGYQHGVIDPVDNTLRQLSAEKLRFWNLYSKIMPKFTLPTGQEDVPFLRLAVGFDLFDPDSEYAISSERLFEHIIDHPRYRHFKVLDASDTFICQCAHVFREGTSEHFAYISDSWHLWKFCDLRELLLEYDSEEFRVASFQRASNYDVVPVVLFALRHAFSVYGDSVFLNWIEIFESSNSKKEKDIVIDSTFADALFDPHPISLRTEEPAWAKMMGEGEWW